LTLTEAERQAEFKEKWQRLESFLAGRKLDALLLKRAENFAWLSGGGSNRGGAGTEDAVGALLLRRASEVQKPPLPHGGSGVQKPLLLRSGKRYVLAANEDVYRLLDEELAGLDFLPKTFKWYKAHVRDEERALVQSLTVQEKVGADVAYPGTAFVGREIDTLRRTLTAAEVRKVRWLGRQAAAAVATVADTLTKGDTEDDAAARLTRELLAARIEPVSVGVTADERMRKYGPAAPRRAPIEQAAVLSVVARRWGLTVCLTRTVYLGQPSAQAQQQQKALARIAAALQAATRPGATLGQILHAGSQAYQEAGYAELWEQSDPGGIIGYRVREAVAFPNSRVPVRESQAVVWRTRLPEVCVEDTFLVTRTGLENLTPMG
jgi:Xaa-Pro aminopeptidase